MFRILQQPYPYHCQSSGKRLIMCVIEGVGVALFFLIFQPFGLSEWQHPHKTLVLMGFGAIVSICTGIHRFLLPLLFPKVYHEQNWTVWKEIVDILMLLLLITCTNMVYSKFFFHYIPLSILGFLLMFFVVALIGLIPISFGVMSNYIYQLKKYNQTIVVNTSGINAEDTVDMLKLIAENEKDILEIKAADLYFIESSDNYSTVFYNHSGTLHKELLRSSLTRLEGQLQTTPVVRCHRSYIVNLDKVAKVTGNAQGYKLHIHSIGLTVPVARKYSEIVEGLK